MNWPHYPSQLTDFIHQLESALTTYLWYNFYAYLGVRKGQSTNNWCFFRFIEFTDRIPQVQELNYSTYLCPWHQLNLEHMKPQQKMKSHSVKQNQQIKIADILYSTIPHFNLFWDSAIKNVKISRTLETRSPSFPFLINLGFNFNKTSQQSYFS